MSEDGPTGNDPFGEMPFFGELFKMFSAASGQSAGGARQLAMQIASDGASEPNVDPAERIALEQLARVAELQVQNASGLAVARSGTFEIEAVNRAGWVDGAMATYEPYIEKLAGSLGNPAGMGGLDAGDPEAAMFAGLFQMLGPMMMTLASGSMIGQLARRSLGSYDLPVPRHTDKLQVVMPNLNEFGEDWSLPVDDLRMWVCLNEAAHHAVLGIPHIGDRIHDLLCEHANAFETDPSAFEEQLGGLNFTGSPQDLAEIQNLLGSPDAVLGAVQSDAQRAVLPQLAAVVAVAEGYVDHLMDSVGAQLIESYSMLSEALRRRRVEADASDRFVEKILGLELTQEQYDRGSAFVEGVIERGGAEALGPLWSDGRALPTPNEVDAPGLWLARIELPEFGDPDAADPNAEEPDPGEPAE
ncbi:MAG: zinc-dependent metalloprotease [Acidimicrobiales bacterium]|nr:zinc-dependent metalloprotease [Acidimicrobiales bacterium]